MKTILAIAMTAAAAITAVPAAAQGQDDNSVRISYGDLNLAGAAGMRTLEGRIKVAATKTCGIARWPSPLKEYFSVKDCQNDFIAESLAQVNQNLAQKSAGGTTIAVRR